MISYVLFHAYVKIKTIHIQRERDRGWGETSQISETEMQFDCHSFIVYQSSQENSTLHCMYTVHSEGEGERDGQQKHNSTTKRLLDINLTWIVSLSLFSVLDEQFNYSACHYVPWNTTFFRLDKQSQHFIR
jgi:hypothetical protein